MIEMNGILDLDKQIISNITTYGKYSRFDPLLNRRETWPETVARNKQMHMDKFKHLYENDSEFRDLLDASYDAILNYKILPSMRSIHFGGKAIEVSNNRMYNCAFLPIDSFTAFSEAMFLLLGGTGVGFSVQKQNVKQLTPRKEKKESYIYIEIEDSIEGWADAIRECVVGVMEGYTVKFDYDKIRPKGTILKTSGGRAPGHEPLKNCIENITDLLETHIGVGDSLKPIHAHDIMCYLGDAVLSGGIRRSAMISLFDPDEDDLITCKSGDWYLEHPHRAMANNSVVFDRATVTKEDFNRVWEKTKNQRYGEPGFYFTNDVTWGTNPCCEIALQNFQFCNLCEVSVSDNSEEYPIADRVVMAAFLGTLQATYTDFHYLRPIWKETTEKEALIGVSMTGVGSGEIMSHDLEYYADLVKWTNQKWAKVLGINPAARTTCVKPAGTSSLVLGTSSGVHAWHNDYYIRRQRVNKSEPLYQYLSIMHPELIEECASEAEQEKDLAIIRTPVKAPEGAIVRHETALEFLERVKKFSTEWVKPGHINGVNSHNVSATVSIREDEWDTVGEWLWDNRENYNGISVLQYDVGGYVQAPHEDCDKETYERLMKSMVTVDLSNIPEMEDNTDLEGEVACAGGLCEIDVNYNVEDTELSDTDDL